MAAVGTIVDWCNANQGFLSACLTLVYVGATLWLVKLSHRQLKQAVDLERSRVRPFVTFDMFFERHFLHAKVANRGQTVALDVRIEITPKLQHVYGGVGAIPVEERTKQIPFIERGLPMLTPGREIKAMIGFSRRVHQAYPDLRFDGWISYLDGTGLRRREAFMIDVAAIEAVATRQTRDIEDVAKQLEEIARTLSHIGSGYSKPLVRTITEKEYIEQEEAALTAAMNSQMTAKESPSFSASTDANS